MKNAKTFKNRINPLLSKANMSGVDTSGWATVAQAAEAQQNAPSGWDHAETALTGWVEAPETGGWGAAAAAAAENNPPATPPAVEESNRPAFVMGHDGGGRDERSGGFRGGRGGGRGGRGRGGGFRGDGPPRTEVDSYRGRREEHGYRAREPESGPRGEHGFRNWNDGNDFRGNGYRGRQEGGRGRGGRGGFRPRFHEERVERPAPNAHGLDEVAQQLINVISKYGARMDTVASDLEPLVKILSHQKATRMELITSTFVNWYFPVFFP